jgi:phosphatidylserine decarboxylase
MKYSWFIYILIICVLYFYRCPSQKIHLNNYNIVYSPAYGKIMEIKKENNKIFIAIFLSPLDVHYQFVPISGKITDIIYDNTGQFNLAYDINKSRYNEKVIYNISNPNGIFTVYQIAGFMVRRITQMVNKYDNINAGELLGLIHFGSRVDIIIPNADKFKLQVKKNDYLKGTKSIIGIYN